MEPTSLLGPFKAGWNWFVDRVRGKLIVSARVHHAYLIHKEPPPPAWFINVENSSPKRTVQVTHVWLETDPPFTILDPGLPAIVKAGREWETAVKVSALPVAAGTDITDLVRVRLSG
jgi:hypothetical protein